MTRKLYKLTRKECDWDEYKEAIVCALSKKGASYIHPGGGDNKSDKNRWHVWAKPEEVIVELIGIAAEHIELGVVMSDFNAG